MMRSHPGPDVQESLQHFHRITVVELTRFFKEHEIDNMTDLPYV